MKEIIMKHLSLTQCLYIKKNFCISLLGILQQDVCVKCFWRVWKEVPQKQSEIQSRPKSLPLMRVKPMQRVSNTRHSPHTCVDMGCWGCFCWCFYITECVYLTRMQLGRSLLLLPWSSDAWPPRTQQGAPREDKQRKWYNKASMFWAPNFGGSLVSEVNNEVCIWKIGGRIYYTLTCTEITDLKGPYVLETAKQSIEILWV